MNKITFIGTGNVATKLSIELQNYGYEIVEIWSKTENSARELSNKIGCKYTTNINDIGKTDLIIICVKDDSLLEVIENLKNNNSSMVHTSGTVGIDVFNEKENCGVLYPLQTFDKNININIKEIPFLIEAKNKELEMKLIKFTNVLSDNVHFINSEKRKIIHLAAVFACNFTNHMLSISEKIMNDNGLDFELLKPLILQTIEKIKTNPPKSVQTGPAKRKDFKIIIKQIDSLEDTSLKTIYKLISEHIISTQNEK